MRTATRWGTLVGFVPFAFLAVFLLFPLAEVASLGLCGADAWPTLRALARGTSGCANGLAEAAAAVGRDSVQSRIAFTFWQAAASTVVTLALGLPAAFVFARRSFPGKAVLRAVLTVPFVLPAVVVALGFLALVGPNGFMPLDVSPLVLILAAHAFYNYAVVVRLVGGAWARLTPRYAEAAATLGAHPVAAFVRAELPLLRTAVAAASLLVFLFSFTSFGIILILGGPGFATLEVSVYEAVRDLDLAVAGALALVQAAVTFLVMVVYARVAERNAVAHDLVRADRDHATTPGSRWGGAFVWCTAALGFVLVTAPLAALVLRSFQLHGAWTLANYATLGANPHGVAFFTTPRDAAWNSLRFAVATAALAVPLGIAGAVTLARRRGRAAAVLDAALMLPLGVSAVTLGLGFMRGFNVPPFDLRTSGAAIVLAHTLIAYPFTVRAVLAAARATPARFAEVATTLGAGPTRRFRRVTLPLLMPGVIVGAVFAFAVSLGEFGASMVITRPEHTTLPLLVYRSLGRPGPENLGHALALATLLMAVTVAAFVILERFRWRDVGEF